MRRERLLGLMCALLMLLGGMPAAQAWSAGVQHYEVGDRPEWAEGLPGEPAGAMDVHDGYTQTGLVAMRADGHYLLYGWQEGQVALLSGMLLPEDGDFSFQYDEVGDKALLFVRRGDERIGLIALGDCWQAYIYQRFHEGGSRTDVQLYAMPLAVLAAYGPDGELLSETELPLDLPRVAALLDFDTFPDTLTEAETYTPPVPLPGNSRTMVCSGCNLRTLPDVRSESLGFYPEGVLVHSLGLRIRNWWLVRVGDTVGWMKNGYIHAMDEHWTLCYQRLPVVTLEMDAPLSDEAGAPLGTLPAGTSVFVLMTDGVRAHVCVPRGEAGWLMDMEGQFGYVPLEAVDQVPGNG